MKIIIQCAFAARVLVLLSIVFAAAASQAEQRLPQVVQQPAVITADNVNLQYTGRIDFSNKQAPSLSWPGSSVTAIFTGTSAAIVLDDQYGKNYFNVFIDQDWHNPKI
jgi:hypothetical protein